MDFEKPQKQLTYNKRYKKIEKKLNIWWLYFSQFAWNVDVSSSQQTSQVEFSISLGLREPLPLQLYSSPAWSQPIPPQLMLSENKTDISSDCWSRKEPLEPNMFYQKTFQLNLSYRLTFSFFFNLNGTNKYGINCTRVKLIHQRTQS